MIRRSHFTAPADDRWFEDYEPGAVYLFGTIDITKAEIIALGEARDEGFQTARDEEAEGRCGNAWPDSWRLASA